MSDASTLDQSEQVKVHISFTTHRGEGSKNGQRRRDLKIERNQAVRHLATV